MSNHQKKVGSESLNNKVTYQKPNGNDSVFGLNARKLKPWNRHKKESETIQRIYAFSSDERHQKYADRIAGCSHFVTWDKITDPNTGEVSLGNPKAMHCKLRFCPVCYWRRANKFRKRFLDVQKTIMKDYPEHQWIFLTLTQKNCRPQDLHLELMKMSQAFNRMTQRKAWPAIGWTKSVEITRSKDSKCHPHFHCLLLVPKQYFQMGTGKYLTNYDYQRLWQESLRCDYEPTVDIRRVRCTEQLKGLTEMASAAMEAFKYSIKFSDLYEDHNWMLEVSDQLCGTKSISFGGVLRKYMQEDEFDDPDDSTETICEKVLLRWDRGVGHYVLCPNTS